MTGREPNPNSDQEGRAESRETDLAVSPSPLFSASRSICRARQAALRSTRAILRSRVACGAAINGVIAAIWHDYRHFKARTTITSPFLRAGRKKNRTCTAGFEPVRNRKYAYIVAPRPLPLPPPSMIRTRNRQYAYILAPRLLLAPSMLVLAGQNRRGHVSGLAGW